MELTARTEDCVEAAAIGRERDAPEIEVRFRKDLAIALDGIALEITERLSSPQIVQRRPSRERPGGVRITSHEDRRDTHGAVGRYPRPARRASERKPTHDLEIAVERFRFVPREDAAGCGQAQ